MKSKETVIVKIYELRDPTITETSYAKSVRYIGKTIRSLDVRLYEHIRDSLTRSHHRVYRFNWIKSLLKKGYKPTIHLIEEIVGFEKGHQVEQYWIKEFKEYGCRLTNLTDGGSGALGYIPSETIRKKTSIRNKEDWKKGKYNHIKVGPVLRFSIDGTFIAEYQSVSDAARSINAKPASVTNVIAKRAKHLRGNLFVLNIEDLIIPTKYQHRLGVNQCSLNNDVIKHWSTIKEASTTLNIDKTSIWIALNNPEKTAGGFKWKHKEY